MQTLNELEDQWFGRAIDWSEPSTLQATGVHHGYRTAPATIESFHSEFAFLNIGTHVVASTRMLEGKQVRKVWWGMLEPGGFILPHIDKGPYYVRWHYPIEAAGFAWQLEGFVGSILRTLKAPSEPFAITHWEPHAVWNPSDKRRVHLIVELDELVPGINHDHDLELFDVLPMMEGLVDAAS